MSNIYRVVFLILGILFVFPTTSFAESQTVDFYPSTQGLAFVSRYIVGTSTLAWGTVRIATEGNESRYLACSGCSGEIASVYSDGIVSGQGAGYRIIRSILSFDTSSLPDNAIVTSAILHIRPSINGNRSTGDNDEYTYIQPVGPANPQSNTSVGLEDFDQAGNSEYPLVWSDTKNTWSDSWNGNSLVNFPLNSNGINGLSKTGYTSLALRQGHDIEDVMPDAYNVWRFTVASSYLEVTYEIPETVSNPAVEKAKAVIGGPYTLGAKGWDFSLKKYLDPAQIKSGELYTNHDWSSIKGLDCSGLTLWSYDSLLNSSIFPIHDSGTDNRIIKYQSADGQYRSNTEHIANGSEQPGDLMFFDWGTYDKAIDKFVGPKDGVIDHVALYVGNQGSYDVVHASSPTTGIISAQKSNLAALAGFVGFGRVNGPRVKLSLKTHSPVDLIVTDPEGFTISATTTVQIDEEINHEISGELYYSVYDIASDGTPETEVYSPKLKTGDYIVKPTKRADAATSSVYSITFETDSGTITVADNIPVSEIPVGGYIVHVTDSGVTSSIRDVIAPEARISVDPTTKDLLIDGVDDLGTTSVSKIDDTTYLVTDQAGNITKLLFQKVYTGKALTFARLIGIQYSDGPVISVPTNRVLYVWNPFKTPTTLLSQTLLVNKTFGVEALFNARKNQTTILVKSNGVQIQKQTVPELRTISLTTNKGVIGYSI